MAIVNNSLRISQATRLAGLGAALCTAVVISLLSGTAVAQEDGEIQELELSLADLMPGGEVVDDAGLQVIQNRKYELAGELNLAMGTFPADAYYKGYSASVGYTYHFGDFFAWELAQFTYSYNRETSLKVEVDRIARELGQVGNRAPAFPEIQWVVSSRGVIKPLYGKQALFNTEVVHVEGYLGIGPALLFVADLPTNDGSFRDGYAFGADFTAGLRFWLGDVTSLRIDIGELVYATTKASSGVEFSQSLHLSVGLAFNLRGEEYL